mgnify:CR=1 FL=1
MLLMLNNNINKSNNIMLYMLLMLNNNNNKSNNIMLFLLFNIIILLRVVQSSVIIKL